MKNDDNTGKNQIKLELAIAIRIKLVKQLLEKYHENNVNEMVGNDQKA